MLSFVVIFLIGTAAFVTALEPADNFREGSCSGIQLRPVKADRDFVDSLKHISGGSKYYLYRAASGIPNYKSMRESEFYYNACYSRNTSTTIQNSLASISGFGRVLSTFRITSKPGIYFQATSTDPYQSWNSVKGTVTMTDNKSFAFMVICLEGVDQRAWALVSLDGKIDPYTQLRVEDHAVSLGFERENLVFLRQNSCRLNCASCHNF